MNAKEYETSTFLFFIFISSSIVFDLYSLLDFVRKNCNSFYLQFFF